MKSLRDSGGWADAIADPVEWEREQAILGGAAGVRVNFSGIGTDVSGSANVVGTPVRGDGNTIAHNAGDGVRVNFGVRNQIRGNAIHNNAFLGIALGMGNRTQPAPVLTRAFPVPGQIRIAGTLQAAPNTSYTIDFHANFDEAPASDVEGRFYLGSVRVRTNRAGVATFSFTGFNPPPGVQAFTATATEPLGNTSQFSAPITSGR